MKDSLFARALLTLIVTFQFVLLIDTAKAEECLSYEPAKVKLVGRMVEKVFPGPPEFESVEKGDEPETVWVLVLNKPVCVKGNPNDEINFETEKNVKNMHLVFDAEMYARYGHLVAKQVVVYGTLYHAHTGYHYTKVLLTVIDIKPVKKKNKK